MSKSQPVNKEVPSYNYTYCVPYTFTYIATALARKESVFDSYEYITFLLLSY